MRLATIRFSLLLLVAFVPTAALVPSVSLGQGPIPWIGGDGNWTDPANWDNPPVPLGTPTGNFDETATIGNGSTVTINSVLSSQPNQNSDPGAVLLENSSILQILSGGVINTTGTTGTMVDGNLAVNNSNVSVSGTASATFGASNFSSGSTLGITGPSATFNTSSLSFGGGTYAPILTSGSHSAIGVTGALNLGGGSLVPSFGSGFTPASGASWVLADAGSITGNFAIDSSQVSGGRSFVTSVVPGGTNGSQLVLDISTILQATVNARTGATTISSPSGDVIEIAGYSLLSGAGHLDAAGWSPITGNDWDVAGTASANSLDQTNGVSTSNIGGTAINLGNAVATNLPFGTTPQVSFEYVTDSNELVQGVVEFSEVNNLLVTVNPTTGAAQLKNSSNTTLELLGYTIASASESLNGAGLTVAIGEDADSRAGFVSELVEGDAVTVAPGQTYSLGSIFNTSGTQDLSLEFLIETAGTTAGDYNQNGVVDAADYTVWRDGLGNGFVQADYDIWKNNFGNTGSGGGGGFEILNGVVQYGSFTAGVATVSAVPEPASLALITLLLGCVAAGRGRRVTV